MRINRLFAALTAATLLVVYSGCGSSDKPDASSTNTTPSKSGDQSGAAPSGKRDIDVALVTPDDFAAIVIHPRRIAQSPLVSEQLKNEMIADRIKKFGIEPGEVEQIVWLFSTEEMGSGMPEPVSTLIAHFTHDVDPKEILGKMQAVDRPGRPQPIVEIHVSGKTCFAVEKDNQLLVSALDKKTIVVTMSQKSASARMEKVFAAKEPKGPLLERLNAADADQDIVFALATEALPDFGKMVDEAKQGAPVDLECLKGLRGATVTFSLAAPSIFRAALDGKDAEAAGKIEKLLQDAKKIAGGRLAALEGSMPREAKETLGPLLKLGDELVDGAKIKTEGSQVVLDVKRPENLDAAAPEIAAAVKKSVLKAQATARHFQELNNLKQISLAMLNYEGAFQSFPPAVMEKGGKPLLSWRVAILPFLDEDALYKQFHLDEPWDSPHNLEVAKTMPSVYQSAESPSDGKTRVMVFTGKDAAFDGGTTIGSQHIRDGASNTVMCVEAGPDKAVPWTKPEDLPFDPEKPSAALGSISPKGFVAAMFDGSVHTLKVDDATLKALITPAGAEPIDWKAIDAASSEH